MNTYLRLVRAQMRSQAQYRTSFAFDLLANVGFGIVDLFNVLVMFAVTNTLGGFDFRAALLIAGLGGTSFALADLLVGNIDTMAEYIRTGRLDALLVRPLSALGQLVAMDFSARRVGRVLISALVLTVAAVRAQVDWTPARAVLLAIAPLAGALLFCGVFIGTATVSFWWIDAGQFGNGFTYGGRDFSMYPTTVYSGLLQKVFAYALGLAFVGYYPALALLGRHDPLGLPDIAGWLSPLSAFVVLALAALAWRFGLRHYRSTGS